MKQEARGQFTLLGKSYCLRIGRARHENGEFILFERSLIMEPLPPVTKVSDVMRGKRWNREMATVKMCAIVGQLYPMQWRWFQLCLRLHVVNGRIRCLV